MTEEDQNINVGDVTREIQESERERCIKIVDKELGEGNWVSRLIRSGD